MTEFSLERIKIRINTGERKLNQRQEKHKKIFNNVAKKTNQR